MLLPPKENDSFIDSFDLLSLNKHQNLHDCTVTSDKQVAMIKSYRDILLEGPAAIYSWPIETQLYFCLFMAAVQGEI